MPAREKIRETLRHREAFDYYYLRGEKRNLQAVARRFRVSKNAVGGWSVVFNWRERILQRDRSNAQAIEERTDINIQEAKTEILKMLCSKVSAWNGMFFGKQVDEKIKQKKISEFTPSDICNFIRLVFSLTGSYAPPAGTREVVTDAQLEAIILAGGGGVVRPGRFDHLSDKQLDEAISLLERVNEITAEADAKQEATGKQEPSRVQ